MGYDKEPIKNEIVRLMPSTHIDQYYVSESSIAITPEEKVKFLELYYATGNQTKAAKSLGRDRMGFARAIESDKVFALDFHAVQQAIKNDLEEVMVTNGMTSKGYMDRITWLRKNFPQEYNPAAVKETDNKELDVLKQLSAKLDEYALVPKKDVIDIEVEK